MKIPKGKVAKKRLTMNVYKEFATMDFKNEFRENELNFMDQLQKEIINNQFKVTNKKIHIRVQQRNGKKSITSIEGFAEDLDLKRICKDMRKKFNCNGNVIEDEDAGEIIQLQGDQRDNVKNWILTEQIINKSEADLIVMHGY